MDPWNDENIERDQHVTELRSKAVKQMDSLRPSANIGARSPEEILHELQVYQVELEMQNEELRRTNCALEESRNRYQDLYEFSPLGYITLAHDCTISEVSLNGATMIGDMCDHLIGRSFSRFVTPQDNQRWRLHFENAMHYGGKHCIELHLQRTDGTQFQARLNLMRLESDDHESGVRMAITDISDVAELRQAVEEAKIAAIVFESQQGLVITDNHYLVLRVNNAFTQISGYPEQQTVGQPLRLLKSSLHDAAFFQAIEDQIRRTGSWQGEIWDQRMNQESFPAFVNITAVKGEDNRITHYVCTMVDISHVKAAETEIRNLAFYDPLTHLPNRRLLQDRLRHAIASRNRNKQAGALLFVDLDEFKILNDTLGHDVGDQLLIQVAEKLSGCIREGDTVARFGGDEFVVILEGLNGDLEECATQVEHIGEKILASLNRLNMVNKYEFHCSASIGVTLFWDYKDTAEELMKRADLAMYQAKAAGRNALRFFDPEMQSIVSARATMENELRAAFAKQEFVLYFQPQVQDDGKLIGFEALVRWNCRRRGIISPGEFIGTVEQIGMISSMGLWVLKSACEQLAKWANNPKTADLTLSVNVSARQFHQPNFVEQVLSALDHCGVNPHRLKLELTESALLHDVNDTIIKMNAIKAHGVQFSLDDFGIGYASLSYLKRLPFDQLKMDQSFIENLLTEPKDAAIAKMVIALAHSMNIEVIAEGVETEEQCDFLSRNGCYLYQGFLFSPPLPQEMLFNTLRYSDFSHHNRRAYLANTSIEFGPRDRRFKAVVVEINRRRAVS
jgi:diguanylate cyclase (GGDEF)-like protein/PAS domain S-box-containing protein